MRATLFRLYFQGPLKALPRAPTLLGHLFWWYRYTHGREALEELLERFRQEPPFRLSSVYPEGWLPRPKLPPVQVEETTLRKALKSLSLVRLDLADLVHAVTTGAAGDPAIPGARDEPVCNPTPAGSFVTVRRGSSLPASALATLVDDPAAAARRQQIDAFIGP